MVIGAGSDILLGVIIYIHRASQQDHIGFEDYVLLNRRWLLNDADKPKDATSMTHQPLGKIPISAAEALRRIRNLEEQPFPQCMRQAHRGTLPSPTEIFKSETAISYDLVGK